MQSDTSNSSLTKSNINTFQKKKLLGPSYSGFLTILRIYRPTETLQLSGPYFPFSDGDLPSNGCERALREIPLAASCKSSSLIGPNLRLAPVWVVLLLLLLFRRYLYSLDMIPYGAKELREYITEPEEEDKFVPNEIKGTIQNINTILFLVWRHQCLKYDREIRG